MTQHTAIGEAKVDAYIKVYRARTGKHEYYRVVGGTPRKINGVMTIEDGKNIEITETEYLDAHKEKSND